MSELKFVKNDPEEQKKIRRAIDFVAWSKLQPKDNYEIFSMGSDDSDDSDDSNKETT